LKGAAHAVASEALERMRPARARSTTSTMCAAMPAAGGSTAPGATEGRTHELKRRAEDDGKRRALTST
jgi:hypothetical protein